MKRHSQSFAPPAGFLAKMRSLLPPDEYHAFAAAYDRPPVGGLRVNTLKIVPAEFTTLVPFSLAPVGAWESAAFTVADDSRPGRHPAYDAGLYYLQDPSAMTAAVALAAAPGELVLDLAAAPGGKATHLAARMGAAATNGGSPLRRALDDDGLLVANDIHAGRARLLADNLARWGAVNVLVTHEEPERLAEVLGPVFDRVLIDAPCSGEAMFRRLESVEWSEGIVAACARRQRGVLAVAPDLVRPGGRLLYATCAFSPEENEVVVGDFLAGHDDFALVAPPPIPEADSGRPAWVDGAIPADIAAQLARAVRLWPHRFPGEGHFLALMARAGQPDGREPAPFARRPPAAAQLRLWREFADATLHIELPEERLHVHGDRLYLLPRRAIDPGRLHLVRYGLPLGETRPGHFRPGHDLALCLTDGDARAVRWAADDARLATYLAGGDLPASDLPSGPDGWTLVTVDGFALGWGKRAGGRLKNHFPRGQRRA
ncbi:MAG: RsmF rRNA methyltransferase first C-terminal domain-containing protein [Candidatus Promineofilum sp.]|nr:RsmF rRNA methyltransferase first C-terminal domain-containing protein [Promineifilum sp.]